MKLKRILMSSLMVAGIAALASCGGENASTAKTNVPTASTPKQQTSENPVTPTGSGNNNAGDDEKTILDVIEQFDIEQFAKDSLGKYVYFESQKTNYHNGVADGVKEIQKGEFGIDDKIVVNGYTKYNYSDGGYYEKYFNGLENVYIEYGNGEITSSYYTKNTNQIVNQILNTNYREIDYKQINDYKNMVVGLLREGSISSLVPSISTATIDYSTVSQLIAPLVQIGLLKITPANDNGFKLELDPVAFREFITEKNVETLRDLLDLLIGQTNIDAFIRAISSIIENVTELPAPAYVIINSYLEMPLQMLASMLSAISLTIEYNNNLQVVTVSFPADMSMSQEPEPILVEPGYYSAGDPIAIGGTPVDTEPPMIEAKLMFTSTTSSFVVKNIVGENSMIMSEGLFTKSAEGITLNVKTNQYSPETGGPQEVTVLDLNCKYSGEFSIVTPTFNLSFDGSNILGESINQYDNYTFRTAITGQKTDSSFNIEVNEYEKYKNEEETLENSISVSAEKLDNEVSIVVTNSNSYQETEVALVFNYSSDVLDVKLDVNQTQNRQYYYDNNQYKFTTDGVASFECSYDLVNKKLTVEGFAKVDDLEIFNISCDSTVGGTITAADYYWDFDREKGTAVYGIDDVTEINFSFETAPKLTEQIDDAIAQLKDIAATEATKEGVRFYADNYSSRLYISRDDSKVENGIITVEGTANTGYVLKVKNINGQTVKLEASIEYDVTLTADINDPIIVDPSYYFESGSVVPLIDYTSVYFKATLSDFSYTARIYLEDAVLVVTADGIKAYNEQDEEIVDYVSSVSYKDIAELISYYAYADAAEIATVAVTNDADL